MMKISILIDDDLPMKRFLMKKTKQNFSERDGITRPSCSVWRELCALCCLLLALGVFCGGASAVLTPKREDCGAMWRQYLKEEEDSVQALWFGSSMAYCDIAPAVIYNETGICSYVMAGPDQTMPMTVRYVRQALKTQSPQVILIEASGLLTARDNRSIKTNITYLPWGKERLSAIVEEPLTNEERVGLLFPLYAFHSRWDKLTAEDFLPAQPDLMAGYTPLFGASPPQKGEVLSPDPAAYELNLQSAREIAEFCKKRSITVIFFLSPVKQALSDEDTARLQEDLTALGIELWNYQRSAEELALDTEEDFYDERHLNLTGAEKFSRALAERLQHEGLTAEMPKDTALWQERTDGFAALKEGDR